MSNAWRPEVGGSIFADAPNAATSAAVIVLQISTRRNITRPRVTRLSPVSSQESGGSTIIVQVNFSPARPFPLLIHTRQINPCPDRAASCRRIGKHCFMNRLPFKQVKQTCDALRPLTNQQLASRRPMSACGTKRTSARACAMSAFDPKRTRDGRALRVGTELQIAPDVDAVKARRRWTWPRSQNPL